MCACIQQSPGLDSETQKAVPFASQDNEHHRTSGVKFQILFCFPAKEQTKKSNSYEKEKKNIYIKKKKTLSAFSNQSSVTVKALVRL